MPDAFGNGEFRAGMALYEDASYLNPYEFPPIVDADETLHIGELKKVTARNVPESAFCLVLAHLFVKSQTATSYYCLIITQR